MVLAAGEPWIRWDWVSRHTDDILAAVREHIELTFIAVALGFVIAFPLALVARRWRRTETLILGVTGVIYTIPSLALLALLVPYTGLSTTTAEIALVGYTLLILVRNIVAGLDGIPDDIREAARGMGFTPTRQLFRVELPLAIPTIVAGLRIATVTTIGLVTVTALIGQGGLGQLINNGLIDNFFKTEIVVGSVLSVALAIAADVGFSLLERLLTPWARARAS
jgi:osmoprotectant transport system permease protein